MQHLVIIMIMDAPILDLEIHKKGRGGGGGRGKKEYNREDEEKKDWEKTQEENFYGGV